jgi:hypothetical protein
VTGQEQNADRLAEIEERFLEALGPGYTRRRQILEARRRIGWAGRWIALAAHESHGGPLLAEAVRHLRRAVDSIERADP